MKAADVTVIDRVAYSAAVSPEQAVAYVRRVLVGWREVDRAPWRIFNAPDSDAQVLVPSADSHGAIRGCVAREAIPAVSPTDGEGST